MSLLSPDGSATPMPIPWSTSKAAVRAAVVLAVCLLPAAVSSAQMSADLEALIARGWAALTGGDLAAAAPLAEKAVAEAATEPARSGLREQARLLLAACRYADGRLEEAARGAGSLEDWSGALAAADHAALPAGFAAWLAAVTAGAPAATLPRMSLAELNPELAVHEVSSHFEMDVEIVRIPVIVLGEGGRFLTELTAEQFAVLDGEPPAQPVYQLIPESGPTSLGILVDASDAVHESTPAVLQAVTGLLAELRDEDEAFLLQFADEPRFLTDFGTRGEQLDQALARYRPGGRRALYDAIAAGLIRMRGARHDKKSLVIIAAGDNDGGQVSGAEVRRAAQRDGVAIHALLLPQGLPRWRPGIGDADQPTFLAQRLAHETGGLVALRPAVDDRFGGLVGWVETATRDIGQYIKHQYLLQFASTNPPPRGQWRDLAVRVSVPHERIRSRSGYVR